MPPSSNVTGRPVIACRCSPPNDCPNHSVNVCYTNRQCYSRLLRDPRSGQVTSRLGCYSSDEQHHLMYCRTKPIPDQAVACCSTNLCNEYLKPEFQSSITGPEGYGHGGNINDPTVLGGPPSQLIMAICVPLILLAVAFGLMILLWRLVVKPRLKEYALKASSGAGKAKSACTSLAGRDCTSLLPGGPAGPGQSGGVAIPVDGSSSLRAQHVGESTLHRLYDISCSSGSGSGLPFLVQRTVARQVSLVECIGKGRYGEVWRGDYHGEAVAVKIFSSREEASWSRETEMYNTLLLRHENILGYFASDMTSRYGCTQLWLITHYHPLGSLFDYLNARVVEPDAGLALIYSAAAGLCHLHTEIFGCQGKPGIAHRDVKSKNILVRVNGSCCIADLGLSVTYSQSSDELNMGRSPSATPSQMPNNKVGTKRYMSPEILTESHCAPGLSRAAAFELLKAADVYALSLVMWEVCRRCVTDGVADEYLIPFSGLVPADPTYEQMKIVVCERAERPPISPRWKTNRALTKVSQVMSEGWHTQADVRLSSLRVKKTLGRVYEAQSLELRQAGESKAHGAPNSHLICPTSAIEERRAPFCESSCEEESFSGSSSQSSNSLLHSSGGAAVVKSLPGTRIGTLTISPSLQPVTPLPKQQPSGESDATTLEEGEETTDPSSMKLLLPPPVRHGLMASTEESSVSTDKKAIIDELIV